MSSSNFIHRLCHCAHQLHMYLMAWRFPGNKFMVLIYDSITQRFKFRAQEESLSLSVKQDSTQSQVIYLISQVRLIFRLIVYSRMPGIKMQSYRVDKKYFSIHSGHLQVILGPEQTQTWRFLTVLKWLMPDLEASPNFCSGGREASTGCCTKSCSCSVEYMCFSVFFIGKTHSLISHFNPAVSWGKINHKFDIPHRLFLTPRQQDLFERVVLYCDQFTNANFIPVLFVLGESGRTVFTTCGDKII